SGTSSGSSSGSGMVTFNLGVQGDTDWMALYVSRVPREVNTEDAASDQANVSDLRRITYFMAGDRLYRQELKMARATDTGSLPPGTGDSDVTLVAKAVTGLKVEYLDPQTLSWQDSWDGTTVGSDGQTPVGPPSAIRVTIDVVSRSGESDEPITRK